MTTTSEAVGNVRPLPRRGKAPRSPAPDVPSTERINIGIAAAPDFSDIAMATAFAEHAALYYRWSPGLDWMRYNGTVWQRDDKLQRYSLAKEIITGMSTLADDDSAARRMCSAKTVQAAIMLAQSEAALVVGADVWDKDRMVLNTPDGIIDLTTGVKRHRIRKSDYVTQAARVSPDPSMACPTWHRFLTSVFLGDAQLIEFMRRSMGYWITGNRREQVVFFLYGLGANGKSVLMELIQWIAGTYTIKLPASVLMQSKGERHPTELAQLRGKRLAVSSELDEGAFFNESLIKELTGDDTLTARYMRQDFFEFHMSQKHVIVGNHKPRLRGGDPAMARRMLLVPFNASFKGDERDPNMLDKLKAEAPGILAWIVQGAVDWNRDGLTVPASVRDASAEYMLDHDDMALWMDECCERQGEAKASDLYSSFARWKKARGEHAPSQTVWGSRITTLTGIEKRKSSGIKYAGVRLTEREIGFLNANTF